MTNLRPALNRIEVRVGKLNTTLPRVLALMAESASDGMRGANYDGLPHGTGISDPTGNAVGRTDRATMDRQRLEQLVAEVDRLVDELDRLRVAYSPLPPAVLRANLNSVFTLEGDPGCQRHAALGSWVPVHRTGTVGGRLSKPESLCRPCYKFVGVTDRPPNKKELQLSIATGVLRPLSALPS